MITSLVQTRARPAPAHPRSDELVPPELPLVSAARAASDAGAATKEDAVRCLKAMRPLPQPCSNVLTDHPLGWLLIFGQIGIDAEIQLGPQFDIFRRDSRGRGGRRFRSRRRRRRRAMATGSDATVVVTAAGIVVVGDAVASVAGGDDVARSDVRRKQRLVRRLRTTRLQGMRPPRRAPRHDADRARRADEEDAQSGS